MENSRPARDYTLDSIRGLAILSMAFGHLAGVTLLSKLLHAPTWIDGAILFVLISGLVLGIVQRSAKNRGGVRYSAMLRRAGFLYVASTLIVIGGTLASEFAASEAARPGITEVGGPVRAIYLILTLQMPAGTLAVLTMYVVLMLAATGFAWLLARGRVLFGLLTSFAVWAFGNLWPDLTTMPYFTQNDRVTFNWATWQFPFLLMFAVGWYWRAAGVSESIRRWRIVVPSAAVALFCFVLAVLFGRLHVTIPGIDVAAAFDKWDLDLAVIVYGLAAFIVLYWLVGTFGRLPVVKSILRWFALLGAFALDSFVILSIVDGLRPLFPDYSSRPLVAFAVAVVTLLLMTLWAIARIRGTVPFVKQKNPFGHRVAAGQHK